MWFHSAQRLRDAAEIIIADQQSQERSYSLAVDEAVSKAKGAPNGTSVDILCRQPNYLPAQLLYAFAIENALKGLILVRNPGWIAPVRLSRRVKSHDLIVLANEAAFNLAALEAPVLEALSRIAEWIGRYPVAAALEDYEKTGNPHPMTLVPEELLGWGSQHPIMRACFDRALEQLKQRLPREPKRFGVVIAHSPAGPQGGKA
jgi:hypothetical protein